MDVVLQSHWFRYLHKSLKQDESAPFIMNFLKHSQKQKSTNPLPSCLTAVIRHPSYFPHSPAWSS